MPAETETPSLRGERARRGGRRRPWWRGGSSVRRWNGEVLGRTVLGLGIGLLAGGLLGGIIGTLVMWLCWIAAVVLALRRGVPRGLLRFRAVDVLYGIVLGGALRMIQGWLDVAFGGTGALPSYTSLDGALPPGWWVDGLSAVVVAPVIEEFFFRGALLIIVFTLVRRLAGGGSAGAGVGIGGFVAVVASAGLFVMAHQLISPVAADAVTSLALVGVVCGLLVVFTGRIWPAVLVHVVYNGTGVLLMVAGTLLG
ncbi:CPBP family intramembrane metalloprotease [Microbacterium aerolatum]|uniref:CPBP family intramembrane glutamic endopeptidase n=1 Tax=Microbacterium aerolatum TaxID=153731 RepID=UPI00200106D0|nr:CPBP family intramembrane glutamic endopeptidase [Microbacterium aerolatum]MCK3769760.1 CPBP family intramembrane metalloprotease [Microbacterium aerolatum]